MRTHATATQGRRKPPPFGGRWLCNRKRYGYTSTTYSTCGNCARILRIRGYILARYGWRYATTEESTT